MAQTRLVDSIPGKRAKPMRVLCLGQSRTGTASLRMALNKVGYRCFHMADAMETGLARNLALLSEAVTLKRSPKKSIFVPNHDTSFPGQAEPWGKKEFDIFFRDYDACADNPACEFVDELVEAYPEAKVVLTLREPEEWLVSVRNTIGTVMRWNWWVAAWDGTLCGPWLKFASLILGSGWDTETKYREIRKSYLDHNDHVRAVVPKGKLLEFEIKDGWAPLCEFLEVEIPKEPFPTMNDSKSFVFYMKMMWWIGFGKFILKTSSVVVVPVALGWYWLRR